MTATEQLAIAPILEHSLRQTLEILCFSEAETLPAASPHFGSVTANVNFSGDRSGSLQMAAEPSTAHALTAAFLGLDVSSEPAAAQSGDALRELAGIVCGRLLSTVNPAASFTLQVAARNSRAPKSGSALEQTYRLPSGDLRVALQFS
ncbi:MAG TPA: chemotaxis protein CheX [Bryobacteraceae bacterium]|jgi:hypothetical protein